MGNIAVLIIAGAAIFGVLITVSLLEYVFNLNNIKSRTVGDGQHGTARFATRIEMNRIYKRIPFDVKAWREGERLPEEQGIIVGCETKRGKTYAYVDDGDVHAVMIAAAGAGKTAYFLYPNLEFACAAGMSFITTDTKGDLARYYAGIAEEYYGYSVSVIDLRNPTRSHGNNILHLVNRYMEISMEDPRDIASRAKAEKYAKITAKTIIFSDSDSAVYGQNAFFYDAAEGLLTATILLVAEFAGGPEKHIVSVFKLIQELLQPSGVKGKNRFQLLMELLPDDHKAKWFAGAALTTAEQAMQSVISTALSRLNAFLDSELEQILCFDTAVDAEKFCREKCAIFVVMPEEDPNKYFMVSLILQQIYREIMSIADANGGRLDNRVMMYAEEAGTLPKIGSFEMMFSASRSRRMSIVAIIQSHAQWEQTYGREGAQIIMDNCQLTIAGGFAPNSESAERISKALGSRTALSGSVSRGRADPGKSLQMIERPLMTPDELKTMKKGKFVVMKTGAHPVMATLKLFLGWGITFGDPHELPERAARKVEYVSRASIEAAIISKYPRPQKPHPQEHGRSAPAGGAAISPQDIQHGMKGHKLRT
jgi:type IV secretion system protein VirD4